MESHVFTGRCNLQKKFPTALRKKLRQSKNSKELCSPILGIRDFKHNSFEDNFIIKKDEILTSNLLDEDLIRVFNEEERKMSKIQNKYNDNLVIFVNKWKENLEYDNKEFTENLPFIKKNEIDNYLNSDSVNFKNTEPENQMIDHHLLNIRNDLNISDEIKLIRIKKDSIKSNIKNKNYDKSLNFENQKEEGIRELTKFGMVYDSFSGEDDENLETMKNNKILFIIQMNSRFKRIFDLISIILVFYSVLIMPLTVCLQIKSSWIIDIIIDMFFIFGVCFNFLTQYKDLEDNLVNSHRKIFVNYISKGFFIDLLTSIPVQIFFKNQYIYDNLCGVVVFFTWIKFLRIFKLFEYHLIVDLDITKKSKLNSIFKLSIIFFIFIHFSSCFWIFIGFTSISNYGGSWIIGQSLLNSSYFDIYIASIYYSLVTVYSIGYGDITPINIQEKIYVLFLLFIGTNFYSYIISSLSILFGNVEYKKIIFNKKMKMLNEITDVYNINEKIFEEIKQNIYYELHNYNYDRYELLDSLPNNIKNELTSVMYKTVILKNDFFTGRSSEFISFVLPYLKSIKFSRNQVIVSSGEYLDEMYIVIKGSLRLGLGSKYNNIDIISVKENEHFGELFLQVNTSCNYQISCKSKYAEVQSLKKNDYLNIKKKFPKEIFHMLELSYSKMVKIDNRTIQLIKLFKSLNSQNEIYKLKRDLHLALMEKNFKNYYLNDSSLGNVDEFIENHNLEDIKKFIDKYKKKSNSLQTEPKRVNSRSEFDLSLLSKVKSGETQIKHKNEGEIYLKKKVLKKKITKKQYVKEIKEKIFPENDHMVRGEEAFNFKTQLLLNQLPPIYLRKTLTRAQLPPKSKNRFLSSNNLLCNLKLFPNENEKQSEIQESKLKIERVISIQLGDFQKVKFRNNQQFLYFNQHFKRNENVKFKTTNIKNNKNKILNQSIYINQLKCSNFSIKKWDYKLPIRKQISTKQIYETDLQLIEIRKLQKISDLILMLKKSKRINSCINP